MYDVFSNAGLRSLTVAAVLLLPNCYGADVPVELAGVSATQTILQYHSATNRPCTVEVSESNTFRPWCTMWIRSYSKGGRICDRAG